MVTYLILGAIGLLVVTAVVLQVRASRRDKIALRGGKAPHAVGDITAGDGNARAYNQAAIHKLPGGPGSRR